MASIHSLEQLLKRLGYRHKRKTGSQILSVTKKYPHLDVETDVVSPNVPQHEVIVLRGTIPVPYKFETYHIPVAIHLPVDFPNSFPVCSVTPTDDMMIKESENVDSAGRVYLKYLSDWNKDSQLVKAVKHMVLCFSDCSPVFMKPTISQSVAGEQTQQQPQPQTQTEGMECIICMEKTRVVMSMPCNHVLYCEDCRLAAVNQGTRTCPVCRSHVDSYVRIFL